MIFILFICHNLTVLYSISILYIFNALSLYSLQVNNPHSRLGTNHFRYNYDAGRSGVYINYREVSNRFELIPGHYVLIPSAFNVNDSGSFLIRVFAQKKFHLKEWVDGKIILLNFLATSLKTFCLYLHSCNLISSIIVAMVTS